MNINIITSDEEDVKQFLYELKNVLISENFNIDTDLDILPKKKDELPTDPYTTGNTMISLDLDREDVREFTYKPI